MYNQLSSYSIMKLQVKKKVFKNSDNQPDKAAAVQERGGGYYKMIHLTTWLTHKQKFLKKVFQRAL